MRAGGRVFIAAVIACLVAAWTCPAYCFTPEPSSAPHASAATAGHEHHHMSEMSMPADGPAIKGVHPLCCEHCGDASQPGVSEQPSPLQPNTTTASLVAAALRE